MLTYICSCMFCLPGVGETWRWGFNSCNGFHDPQQEVEYKGIQPLWWDVLQQNTQVRMQRAQVRMCCQDVVSGCAAAEHSGQDAEANVGAWCCGCFFVMDAEAAVGCG